ncbi:SRPBCC family protein, partial [Nonomuraea sp. KC401]
MPQSRKERSHVPSAEGRTRPRPEYVVAVARPHRESVQVHIRAEPRAVWNLIADVTRMGEWSPVCRRCAWIAPATGPAAGARFVGHNRMAGLRWSRECEVVVCEPGTEFAF